MSGKANLSYGLNARNTKKRRRGGGLAGFGDDDSSDESTGGGGGTNKNVSASSTTRSDINRAIAAEQSALRQRAAEAMKKSSVDAAVYDYDAEYDVFSSGKKKEDEARAAKAAREAAKNGPKKPKYITSLLKTAERRNREQEVVYERKVQKEQAAEDAEEQYAGKDKFITSSYKRKLAEREQWAKEEAERAKREEEEDVTKKTGAGNFMFGGIGRSMLMGRGGKKADEDEEEDMKPKAKEDESNYLRSEGESYPHGDDYQHHRESSRETERWGSSQRCRDAREDREGRPQTLPPNTVGGRPKEAAQPTAKTRKQILEERAAKIREARERYFKRRGMVTQ